MNHSRRVADVKRTGDESSPQRNHIEPWPAAARYWSHWITRGTLASRFGSLRPRSVILGHARAVRSMKLDPPFMPSSSRSLSRSETLRDSHVRPYHLPLDRGERYDLPARLMSRRNRRAVQARMRERKIFDRRREGKLLVGWNARDVALTILMRAHGGRGNSRGRIELLSRDVDFISENWDG